MTVKESVVLTFWCGPGYKACRKIACRKMIEYVAYARNTESGCNNINKYEKIWLEEVPEDLSSNHFFSFGKTFFKVSAQNFGHHFTWHHWLRKFPIAFQAIIIQNYDVYFALELHLLHWCYTFCIGVTVEPHCSQPIRIE